MVSRGRTTKTAGATATRSPTTSTSATRAAVSTPSPSPTRTTRKQITQQPAGKAVQAQFKQAVSSAVKSVGVNFGVPTVKTTVQETATEIITITEKPEVIEEQIIEEQVIEEQIIEEPFIELPQLLPEVFAEEQQVLTQEEQFHKETITDNMVTQQVINFNIINGRAVGSIKFVATNNFNPIYYSRNIVNIIQIKDPNGVVLLTKENRLNFTNTERDEIISYDEDVKQNTRATVESFVWSSATQPTAFSKKFTIEISEKEPPKPIQAGFMGAGALGALAGLILIGFIADHKRG